MNLINLPALLGLRQRCMSHAKKENALGLSTTVGDTASPPALLAPDGKWNDGIKNYQLYLFDIHADSILTVSHVRLSDMGVFAALMTLPPMQRGTRYPYDFDARGHLRQSRTPVDPPVVIWSHGVPWFAVYKSSYVLYGSYKAAMGYLIGHVNHASGEWLDVGIVLAPTAAVQALKADPLTQTQLTLEKSTSVDYGDSNNGIIKTGIKNRVVVRMVYPNEVYYILSLTQAATISMLQIPGLHPRVHTGIPTSFLQDDFAQAGVNWDTDAPVNKNEAIITIGTLIDWDEVTKEVQQLASQNRKRSAHASARQPRKAKTAKSGTQLQVQATPKPPSNPATPPSPQITPTTPPSREVTPTPQPPGYANLFTAMPTFSTSIQAPTTPFVSMFDHVSEAIDFLHSMDGSFAMLDVAQGLRKLNGLRQAFDGNGRAMWLIGQGLSKDRRAEIRERMARRQTDMEEFWKRVSTDDYNQIEDALRLLDGLDGLDQAAGQLSDDDLVKDAIRNIKLNLTRDEKKNAPMHDTLNGGQCPN